MNLAEQTRNAVYNKADETLRARTALGCCSSSVARIEEARTRWLSTKQIDFGHTRF
jgi:hypothetical protein